MTDKPIVENKDVAAISIGNWLGTWVLLAIPLVNIIMLLVWSFGSKANPSKKTFARATIVWWIILIVVITILSIVAGAAIVAMLEGFQDFDLSSYLKF